MDQSKRCPRCGLDLPIAAFNYRDTAHRRIQSYCRDCSNAAWRDWYSVPDNRASHLKTLSRRRKRRIARNKDLVRRLKEGPCADCKERYPPEAMDFDHLSDKEALISKLVFSAGPDRLLDEIAKCDVVCANCHRVRTTQRLRGEIDM